MTVTATPEPSIGGSAPRIRLDFDAGPGETFVSLTVTRDGRPLARSLPPVGVQETFTYDYEMPLNRPTVYMASGETTAGPYAQQVAAQLDESGVWLIHPSLPGLSMCIDRGLRDKTFVTIDSRREMIHQAPLAAFSPPGRKRSVVYPMGPRRDPDWLLEIALPGLGDRDTLVALLADSAPLLMRAPFGYESGDWDMPDGWYSAGEVSELRPEIGVDRSFRLSLTPVAEPPVRLAPVFTWGDLVSRTWGDLLPHTWLDVLAGEV